MQAMTRSVPPQAAQRSMSMPKTRMPLGTRAGEGPELGLVTGERIAGIVAAMETDLPAFESLADVQRESAEELAIVWRTLRASDPEQHVGVGDLTLLPPERWVMGPGSSDVMTAFTHPSFSRFSDERHGAYYAAADIETAVDETVFHKARMLRASGSPSTEIDMSVLHADIRADLHDVRGPAYSNLRDPDPSPTGYDFTQRLARSLRQRNSRGIVYASVRRASGECVAIFDPLVVSLPVRRAASLQYRYRRDTGEIEVFDVATRRT